MTLAAALFALAAREADPRFALIAFFPAVSFWMLDAYYLRQERLFRCLYDDVRKPRRDGVQSVEPFSMTTSSYQAMTPNVSRLMFIRPVVLLHGIVLGAVVVVLFLARSAKVGGM